MRAFIGLGGNVGDVRATFAAAARQLRTIGDLLRASSLYASAPRDLVDQPEFTNATIELQTDLTAAQLLFELKRIEHALGRDPQGVRFGPRALDLDILSLDGRCVEDVELPLIVPHPRLHERRFALEPLAELDPGLRPWRGCADVRRDVTVADLLATVADQDVRRVGGADWADPVSDGWTKSRD
jgi:2-amino-4-hydroxy-6-hydroxymethyldihydropteridine diphosphokinase